jgi:nifR3 family TIM-barrel protein
MSYTEFINAIDVVNDHPYLANRLAFLEEERPIVFQIFDNDPDRLVEAAVRLREYRPDIIDVNMGCSTKHVSRRGAGAGLMRSPIKVARIFRKLTKAMDIPVTGKIRLGWDEGSKNYALVARIIEENGGKLVAIHARTKKQGYGGKADWDAIAEIKQLVSIPVIGNGDVCTVKDIAQMKQYTDVDAVMIGRAAIGNPWIFARKNRSEVSDAQVRAIMKEHLKSMLGFYGVERGLPLFRKHAARYISPYALSKRQRTELLTCQTVSDFYSLLDHIVMDRERPT